MIDFILRIPKLIEDGNLKHLFVNSPGDFTEYSDARQELLMWGDPAGGDDIVMNPDRPSDPGTVLSQIRGHFYFLLFDRKEKRLFIGNSLFSILPVYFCDRNGEVFVSNNALDLGRTTGLDGVSRRFILETVLFNYPLFNHSIIEKISLLPSNSYMEISSGAVSLVRHTSAGDYFSPDPVPWRKAGDMVADTFIETVKRYLPEGRYINALTGGLDSRTLVAAGLAAGGDVLCYSFGARGSSDVEIPGLVSDKTGLPYLKILLEDEYIRDASLQNGIDFILNASGSASFVRGHYLYAAKILSQHSGYMITGNFGSELFRTANVRGIVFSPNLVTLFSSRNPEEAFKFIRESSQFGSLAKRAFDPEWDQLKQDLLTLPCFSKENSHLTRNQRFYIFILEEVFRKYFGAEMVNQFSHLRNRTPFLDSSFLKILLGTGYAGVYSDFFENNPFKRYKGQVLYAEIIRKSKPELGRIITDKGYCPDDLLTPAGRLSVVRGYLKKKRRTADRSADPYSARKAFRHNTDFFRQVPVDRTLFNAEMMNEAAFTGADSRLYMILSLSLAMSAAEGKVSRPEIKY